MKGFLEIENRFFIMADIVLERPLHLGKGVSLEPIGTDLPVMKDVKGFPFMPGSSIKGVLRSELERITRTLASSYKLRVCEPFSKPCIKDERKGEIERDSRDKEGKLDEELFSQRIWDESCNICRLFGSPWLASRISFKDCLMKNQEDFLLPPFEVRDGIAIDRDTGVVKEGAKFDYEVVYPGVRFSFEAVLENVDSWEAGLFLLVLKLWERGEVALGGRTSAGLGWGKLKNIKLEKVEKGELLDYILKGEKKPEDMEKFIEEFKKELEKRRI